jgi:hypothetical protein
MSDVRKLLDEAIAKNAAFHAEQKERMIKVKEEASQAGKEVFEPAKLSRFLSIGAPIVEDMGPEELIQLEVSYYLRHPDIKTLAEFAEVLNQI